MNASIPALCPPALWVARHAPAKRRGICYGRAEVEVAIAHGESAETLARAYAGAAPAVVWSSPLKRCRAVAERLAIHWDTAFAIDDALHELDFGAWESRAWDDIASDDAARFGAWSESWLSIAPPGGESARDLEARVHAWWSSLDRTRTHALVAHAGVVRALRVVLLGMSWNDAMSKEVAHLEWARHDFGREHG